MNTKILALAACLMIAFVPSVAAESSDAANTTCDILHQSVFEYVACVGGGSTKDICDKIFGEDNCKLD